MSNRVVNYLKETRAELKHVSWPTRRQALIYTALVIGISLLTAAALGLFDFVFTTLLENYVV
jgi:preprotein translocase subunit SecE